MAEFGDRLKTKIDEYAKNLRSANMVKVGWSSEAKYEDGTYVAQIAAIQEFGAPKRSIPPRPFMRPLVRRDSKDWGGRLNAALKHYQGDAEAALEALGQEIEADLIEEIANVNDPPLSPITLMLRKWRKNDPTLKVTGKTVGEAAAAVAAGESTDGVSTKPLNDTGHMLDTIRHIVE